MEAPKAKKPRAPRKKKEAKSDEEMAVEDAEAEAKKTDKADSMFGPYC